MSKLTLRTIDIAEHTLINYCKAIGNGYFLMAEGKEDRLIILQGFLNGKAVRLYCDVDSLLSACSEVPEALPVDIISRELLLSFATHYFSCHGVGFPFSKKQVDDVRCIGFADATPINYPLVSAQNGNKVIWVELANVILPVVPKKSNYVNWQGLFIPVEIFLGYTLLSWPDVIALEIGDIIILDIENCKAIVAEKITIKLNFDGERMVIESLNEYDSVLEEDSVTLSSEGNIALDNLDVKVDFLLQEKMMTLAELQHMQVNQILPLDIDTAALNVCLRVGKHIIASGELVTVDDKLAVEIHKVNGSA